MLRRLILLPALLLSGCAPHPPVSVAGPPESAVDVHVQRVTSHREAQTVEYSGVVRALHVVSLATRATGRITAITVDEGDRVRTGQILARVDMATTIAQTSQASAAVSLALAGVSQSQQAVAKADAAVVTTRARLPELQAQLREAQAAETQAHIDQHRYHTLYHQDAVPRAMLDRANTDLQAAHARVAVVQAGITEAQDSVRQSEAAVNEVAADVRRGQAAVAVAQKGVSVAASDLPYGELVAPFNGTVIRRLAHAGDLATPGRAVLEVQDTSQLHLEVEVPEEAIRLVHPGSRFTVHLDALAHDQAARVYELIPSSNPDSHTVLVKLALSPCPGLVPGLYGRVAVRNGTREVVRIPPSAVVHRGELTEAWVVQQGHAAPRWLRLSGDEVLSGLQPGDDLIVSPVDAVHDGQPVHVQD